MKIIKVCENENIESIIKKYKIPRIILEKYNNLTCEISEGDRLIIPFSAKAIHIVKPLESILDISRKYNIPIEKIKRDNNIIAPLFIGQQIIIK